MVQDITSFQVIQGIGIIVAIVVGIWTILRQKKKDSEKFATKTEVKLDLKIMDTKILSIEKDMDENKRNNSREHDAIKNDIIRHFDSRINDLMQYLKKIS